MDNFTCAGCGKSSPPPSLDWTSVRTRKIARYCAACDDLLIQDQPLPLAEARARLARPRAGRKPIENPKPSTLAVRKWREGKKNAN